MPDKLSYSLMADWKGGIAGQEDAVRTLGNKLVLCGVPSIYIGRDKTNELTPFAGLCDVILKRGILPVLELHPGDPSSPIRNLAEVCCLGVIPLKWENGQTAFDWDDLFSTVDAAGRHRLPIDLILDFEGTPAEIESIAQFLPRLDALSRKYAHIQVVKLNSSIPASDLFRIVLKACPSATAAVSPGVWKEMGEVRHNIDDLGLLKLDADSGIANPDECAPGALKPLLGTAGLEFVPRLPLLKNYYRKGWFSFEVGKVLDSWVDKKAFKYYSERPGWL